MAFVAEWRACRESCHLLIRLADLAVVVEAAERERFAGDLVSFTRQTKPDSLG